MHFKLATSPSMAPCMHILTLQSPPSPSPYSSPNLPEARDSCNKVNTMSTLQCIVRSGLVARYALQPQLADGGVTYKYEICLARAI